MQSHVIAVRKETPDTVTLTLAAPFAYKPGQFAMVGVHLEGKELKRSYSIASVHNGSSIDITVKRQDPGLFSQYAQHMDAGDEINVYGPYGHHFLFDTTQEQDVVFIAGGSGIAPFRCMLYAAKAVQYKGRITLLYSAKTSEDVIYRQELADFSSFARVVITLTRPTEHDLLHWKGKFGRVTGKLLRDELGDFTTKQFYVCGPTSMVQDVQLLLANSGVPKQQVKTEKFGAIEG